MSRLLRAAGTCAPVARILDAERRRQDLTVYRLAQAAGMSPSRLGAILDGSTRNPGILTVAAILAALGKSFSWLDQHSG